MEPLISVVLPTYNRKDKIGAAIESVLQQTYQNIELIIVDDHSDDGTLDFVTEKYGEDDRILYIINDVNLGCAGARNVGIDAACGEWVAFQDSDDIWSADKLEKQMRLAETAGPQVGMIYSQVRHHLWNGEDCYPSESIPMESKSGNIFPCLLIYSLCGTPTMLAKKACLEEIGKFNSELHALEDYEMSLRFAKKYEILLCNEPLTESWDTAESVGKQYEEKIRVQCMIMDAYREELAAYGLKERKARNVILEAVGCKVFPAFEEYFLSMSPDEDYLRVYLASKRILEEMKFREAKNDKKV